MSAETVMTEERRSEQAAAPPDVRAASHAEAAEIRAWRVDKVRRLPRRAWTLVLRVIAVCVFATLALVVLAQVIPFTATSTQGVSRSSAPHQK